MTQQAWEGILWGALLEGYQSGYLAGLEQAHQDAFRAGYLEGLVRGRQQADDEAAALHHRAYVHVQALARDHIDGGFDGLTRRRRQHELAAAARAAAEADPWPPETAPIHPRALFGPHRQAAA